MSKCTDWNPNVEDGLLVYGPDGPPVDVCILFQRSSGGQEECLVDAIAADVAGHPRVRDRAQAKNTGCKHAVEPRFVDVATMAEDDDVGEDHICCVVNFGGRLAANDNPPYEVALI